MRRPAIGKTLQIRGFTAFRPTADVIQFRARQPEYGYFVRHNDG